MHGRLSGLRSYKVCTTFTSPEPKFYHSLDSFQFDVSQLEEAVVSAATEQGRAAHERMVSVGRRRLCCCRIYLRECRLVWVESADQVSDNARIDLTKNTPTTVTQLPPLIRQANSHSRPRPSAQTALASSPRKSLALYYVTPSAPTAASTATLAAFDPAR